MSATISLGQPSLLARVGQILEQIVTLRYLPPPPRDGENKPDDETMIQVALICSAHF